MPRSSNRRVGRKRSDVNNTDGHLIAHPPLFTLLSNPNATESALIFTALEDDTNKVPVKLFSKNKVTAKQDESTVLDWDWLSRNVINAYKGQPCTQVRIC